MKKNKILLLFLLFLSLISIASADIGPHPGGSSLYPYIANMNESQDYVLVAMVQFGESVLYGQCQTPVAIIGEDGLIPDPDCYRDDISLSTIYAVKKSDFSNIKFNLLKSGKEKGEYVFSLSPIKVIKGVPANTEAAHLSSNLDAAGKTSQYYTINFTELKNSPGMVVPKDKPDEQAFEADYAKILLGFALTFCIELAIVLIFMRKSKKKELTNKKIALYIFLINLVTWPTANFLLPLVRINFLAIELVIMIAESFLLMWAFKIKYSKALLISVVANLASFVIGGVILLILLSGSTDSGSITENKLMENQFNASEYPVVIDKTEYPELLAFERSISERYETMLWDYYEEFYKGREYEYECFSSPAVSKLSFDHLKPKHDLYRIESDCGIPGDTISTLYRVVFYVIQGDIVMFYEGDVETHFTEVFNDMESLDELKDYSGLYVDDLAINLGSALNNSYLDSSPESFIKDCPLVSDIPELASTVSKEGDGFVYEGLKIRPELPAELYYLKYSITPGGQVSKDKEDLLAQCENIGIIY